jgi:hypothetical protein
MSITLSELISKKPGKGRKSRLLIENKPPEDDKKEKLVKAKVIETKRHIVKIDSKKPTEEVLNVSTEPSQATAILLSGLDEKKETEQISSKAQNKRSTLVNIKPNVPTINVITPQQQQQQQQSTIKTFRESPKQLFEKYLLNLNNVADYNRGAVMNQLRGLVGADFNAILASRVLDNIEPQNLSNIEKYSEYIDNTSNDIIIVSPIDITFAYYIRQKQLSFKTNRNVYAVEAVAPIDNIIDNLNINNLSLISNTPFQYIISDKFRINSINCDLVYFNARFCMPQLYLFLFHALSAMNSSNNRVSGNKYILLQSLKSFGDDVKLKDLLARISKDDFFNIVLSDSTPYTNNTLDSVYAELTNNEFNVKGGAINTELNRGNVINDIDDSKLQVKDINFQTKINILGSIYTALHRPALTVSEKVNIIGNELTTGTDIIAICSKNATSSSGSNITLIGNIINFDPVKKVVHVMDLIKGPYINEIPKRNVIIDDDGNIEYYIIPVSQVLLCKKVRIETERGDTGLDEHIATPAPAPAPAPEPAEPAPAPAEPGDDATEAPAEAGADDTGAEPTPADEFTMVPVPPPDKADGDKLESQNIGEELLNVQEIAQEQRQQVSDLLSAIKKLLNYSSFKKVSTLPLTTGGSLYSYVIEL